MNINEIWNGLGLDGDLRDTPNMGGWLGGAPTHLHMHACTHTHMHARYGKHPCGSMGGSIGQM